MLVRGFVPLRLNASLVFAAFAVTAMMSMLYTWSLAVQSALSNAPLPHAFFSLSDVSDLEESSVTQSAGKERKAALKRRRSEVSPLFLLVGMVACLSLAARLLVGKNPAGRSGLPPKVEVPVEKAELALKLTRQFEGAAFEGENMNVSSKEQTPPDSGSRPSEEEAVASLRILSPQQKAAVTEASVARMRRTFGRSVQLMESVPSASVAWLSGEIEDHSLQSPLERRDAIADSRRALKEATLVLDVLRETNLKLNSASASTESLPRESLEKLAIVINSVENVSELAKKRRDAILSERTESLLDELVPQVTTLAQMPQTPDCHIVSAVKFLLKRSRSLCAKRRDPTEGRSQGLGRTLDLCLAGIAKIEWSFNAGKKEEAKNSLATVYGLLSDVSKQHELLAHIPCRWRLEAARRMVISAFTRISGKSVPFLGADAKSRCRGAVNSSLLKSVKSVNKSEVQSRLLPQPH